MWTRLQKMWAWIIASTDIETTRDCIAYHAPERGGELNFSQTSSLRRYY